MFMRNLRAATFALGVVAVSLASAQEGPNLGVEATPAQVAGWDVSVSPEGSNLPPGSGTAKAGAEIFTAKCFACHGERGEGLVNDKLSGGQGTIATDHAVKTIGSYWPYATTVFDYVRRAMPYPEPHSLTDHEAYALTAYLLYVNGIIGENDVIDAKTLPRVKMPNRDNFIQVYKAPR